MSESPMDALVRALYAAVTEPEDPKSLGHGAGASASKPAATT